MTSDTACINDQATFPLFQAEGYTDGDLTLFHSFTVTTFLKAENPVDFLGKTSEVRSLYFFNLSKIASRKLDIFFCHFIEVPV